MVYNDNYAASGYCDQSCIKSEDVIPALRETFEFIQSHPTVPPADCVITLKKSLLQYENNQTKPPISMTTNTIYGKIKKIHSTFVELSFPTVENETFQYTISYENIISLSSSSLSAHYEDYLKCMSKLPPLCKRTFDSNYDLLRELHKILSNELMNLEYVIMFIPSGILSEDYNLSDVKIVRNLVFIEKYFVIPISHLSGYIVKPKS